MSIIENVRLGLLTSLTAATIMAAPASAQQAQKPNILVIMADDIGYWNISAHSRGMMGCRSGAQRFVYYDLKARLPSDGYLYLTTSMR